MPTLSQIILALHAGAEALTETAKFFNSPAGQKLVEKALDDRAAWDKFWASAGATIERYFSALKRATEIKTGG